MFIVNSFETHKNKITIGLKKGWLIARSISQRVKVIQIRDLVQLEGNEERIKSKNSF